MRGDERELFERYSDRLRRSVTASVHTSYDNIDDACAFAWMQLFRKQPRRETAYNWLWKVAWREAVRLDALSRRTDDVSDAHTRVLDPRDPIAAKELMLDVRDQLKPLRERERAGMLLRGMGYTYEEAAKRLGVSPTRLNAILTRSVERLNRKEQEMQLESADTPPRARLLGELLRNPPPFLHAAIGRPPVAHAKKGGGERRLEWSRLALAIIDYRLAHGVSDPARPFGHADRERSGDEARQGLERQIARFEAGRPTNRHREIGR